jgi:hypothetical protein
MDKHEEQVIRADEASRILNSELFDKAFTDTRQALMNGLASLDNLDDRKARDLHAMVKALDKVRKCLEVHIDTGKLASKEIEHRSRLADLLPIKRRA